MQDIRSTNLAEMYTIVPLRGGGKRAVQGLTILVNSAVFPYFLEQHLAPVHADVVAHVSPRYGVRFTPFTDCATAARQGFGFQRGIRLGRVQNGDGTSHTQIHVLFQRARKIPRWGWPGYPFVLNMHWLLQSLLGMDDSSHITDGQSQLFTIQTGFSGGLDYTGFPVTVTVSQTCASILSYIVPKSFEMANDAIADALDWFRGPQDHNLMQVRAGRNGTLSIHQEPYALSVNPMDVNLGEGYRLYSDNVSDPVGQIVLLVGLASVWEELRKRQSTTA